MSNERTLSIINPDATKRNIIGKIISRFESQGLEVIALKKLYLSREQAEMFYSVHSDKPFFNELCDFMTSGSVVVQVLQGDNAVARNREIMGATNPSEASEGTIRKDFAESLTANSVHGSDSVDNAKKEISFFFSDLEFSE